MWRIPPKHVVFVYHMEDVLEVDCRPFDLKLPVVCLDETFKQPVGETRAPPHMTTRRRRAPRATTRRQAARRYAEDDLQGGDVERLGRCTASSLHSQGREWAGT